MSDPHRPIALILARWDNPLLVHLDDALAQHGLRGLVCNQAAQAFIHLAHRETAENRIAITLILEPLQGLPVDTLARALRGLPHRCGMPLILVDAEVVAPLRALVLRPPTTVAELARWAAMPMDKWPLPAGGAPTTVATPDSEPASTTTGQRTGIILVVDDCPVNRTVLRLQVQKAGLPTETCEDGAAAVTRIAAGGVRLVLMDCQMPVMDGYEATRIVRRAEIGTGRHLPIIAVTAHAMEENRSLCQEAGMDAFLTKPVTQEPLLRAIICWLADLGRMVPFEQNDQPTAHAVLDTQPLLMIERGAAGTACQLAGMLAASLTPFSEALLAHLAHDNLPGVSRIAHKLKSSSGSLGAMELYQVCCDLDLAARKRDRTALTEAVPAALQAVHRLHPELVGFLATMLPPCDGDQVHDHSAIGHP
jgi:CheY-like chemotaxis protein